MPRKTRSRDIDGVLLLDKPTGLTSNQALQRVKRMLSARKAGHTGSLDPLASGMLPVCFGQATKVSSFLLDADKRYIVTGKLGEKTTTADAEGEVIATHSPDNVTKASVEAALLEFCGEIEQVPPMHSAVKHQGKRLYELARKGLEVERRPRAVTIHELRLLSFCGEQVQLDVRCSKGTYVRTLVEAIAERLGSYGHVTALRRLSVGPYEDDAMHPMEEIERLAGEGSTEVDRLLLPIDSALKDWPSVNLKSNSAFFLMQGQPVMVSGAYETGLVRLYGDGARFLGVGELRGDGRVRPKRLFPTRH